MPTLKRACMYPMCSNYAQRRSHYCEKHDAATKAMSQSMYNERRGTAASRGYDHRWRKLRLMVLRKEPLCRECGRGATVVDHVIPHRGDRALFNDPYNLQSLCKACHNKKSGRENSGFHHLMYPLDLPRLDCPAVIVCGPPGAGKNTLVEKKSTPGDALCDLDIIKARVGGDLKKAVHERNEALRRLASDPPERLWFIVTAPHAAERSFWARTLSAEVWLLMPDEETCVERIKHDASRVNRGSVDQQVQAVRTWFKRFTTREGDTIIPKTSEVAQT